MKRLFWIFLLSILLIPSELYSQKSNKGKAQAKGHELVFNIPNSKDSVVYMVIYYRDKFLIKDTARVTMTKSGPQFVFSGKNEYQGGLYKLVNQKHFPYMDFLIDGNQFFSATCDTTGQPKDVHFVNSPQNDVMIEFQVKTMEGHQKMSEYKKSLEEAKSAGNQSDVDKYTALMNDLDSSMKVFIKNIIDENPTYLFSKVQKIYQQIDIPEAPILANGKKDSTFQARYFLTHYWDNVDLGDSRLLFTPVFEPRMKEYFTRYLQYYEPDTINHYVDMFLRRTEADTLMYHFCVDWLSYHYETSKILGQDGVFVHIVKTNHQLGKCTWIDDDLLRKYEKRARHLDPILIGRRAPEMVIPDTSLTDDYTKWISSYYPKGAQTKRYVILWFYDPDCPTCKKESKKLRAVYDSLENLGQRNFDVYAVANDADTARWKKYVKENNYPWVNVGGNKGNIDYLEAYNIYESGNPSMFIVNEKHEIILNRRIEMNSIQSFLEQYEKRKK